MAVKGSVWNKKKQKISVIRNGINFEYRNGIILLCLGLLVPIIIFLFLALYAIFIEKSVIGFLICILFSIFIFYYFYYMFLEFIKIGQIVIISEKGISKPSYIKKKNVTIIGFDQIQYYQVIKIGYRVMNGIILTTINNKKITYKKDRIPNIVFRKLKYYLKKNNIKKSHDIRE
jgi:hypothetical protein